MNRSFNYDGFRVCLDKPLIMGILNLSEDSFYEGSRVSLTENFLERVEGMINEGVDIIDIGAISSKPFSIPISEKEELSKIVPAVKKLHKAFPEIMISVDTFRSTVAESCVNAGAGMINDIYGGLYDPKILEVAGKYNCSYILMHMQGTPETMQVYPQYKNVITDVTDFFSKRLEILHQHQVKDIILDPGFGFGKTIEDNYKLLYAINYFKNVFNLPISIGVSRKSMITKVLKNNAKDAIAGTISLHTIALLNGASILRVHDVKEAKECRELVAYYSKINTIKTPIL